MSDSNEAPTRVTRTRVIAAVVGLVLVVAVLVALTRGGEDDTSPGSGTSSGEASPGADGGAGDEPAADETPTDAPPPGQSGEDGAGAPIDEEGADGGDSDGSDSGGDEGNETNGQRPIRVALREPARPSEELRVRVSDVEKVRSRAELPGETSRPALRITVQVDNLTNAAVPIGEALTNVYFGPDRSPATLVQRPGGRPFPASVAPGASAVGVFVANVPEQSRARVVFEVSLDSQLRRVEFAGDCTGSC